MADTSSQAAAPATATDSSSPARPSRVLSQTQLVLHRMAAAFCIAMFALGCAGLVILMDKDGKWEISRSNFADRYRQLMQMNPLFSSIFFNGGMLGTFFFLNRLFNHYRAVQEPTQAARSGVKATGTSKEANGGKPAVKDGAAPRSTRAKRD